MAIPQRPGARVDDEIAPTFGGAGAQRMRRRSQLHANFLQVAPIAVLSFFKGLDSASAQGQRYPTLSCPRTRGHRDLLEPRSNTVRDGSPDLRVRGDDTLVYVISSCSGNKHLELPLKAHLFLYCTHIFDNAQEKSADSVGDGLDCTPKLRHGRKGDMAFRAGKHVGSRQQAEEQARQIPKFGDYSRASSKRGWPFGAERFRAARRYMNSLRSPSATRPYRNSTCATTISVGEIRPDDWTDFDAFADPPIERWIGDDPPSTWNSYHIGQIRRRIWLSSGERTRSGSSGICVSKNFEVPRGRFRRRSDGWQPVGKPKKPRPLPEMSAQRRHGASRLMQSPQVASKRYAALEVHSNVRRRQ